MVKKLPDASIYLFVRLLLEGFSHREIEELNITEK